MNLLTKRRQVSASDEPSVASGGLASGAPEKGEGPVLLGLRWSVCHSGGACFTRGPFPKEKQSQATEEHLAQEPKPSVSGGSRHGPCSTFCTGAPAAKGPPLEEASMVRLGMEPSSPGGDPGLRDVFSDRYGRGGADRGGLGETRSSPPAESTRPSSPFALLEDLDLWLDGWQGAEGATINEGPPLMQEESPPKTGKDPTLDLFQASIRQAQLCVLELQGEIDRQVGSPSQEPLHLTTDSEEEEDEKEEEEEEGMPEEQEEEEEEEEEEMECLFYDNPLFQESPGPSRDTDSFEDPAPEVQEVRSPPPGPKEILLGWRRHPPATSASDPSPLLTSLPQSHPLPPLVITEEGDEEEELELPRKEEEEGIKMQAPWCFPPQADCGLSRGVSEGPAAGAHPTGQGLQMQAPRCFPPQPDGGLSGGVSEGPAAGAHPTGQGLQMQAPRCFTPQPEWWSLRRCFRSSSHRCPPNWPRPPDASPTVLPSPAGWWSLRRCFRRSSRRCPPNWPRPPDASPTVLPSTAGWWSLRRCFRRSSRRCPHSWPRPPLLRLQLFPGLHAAARDP
nr:splicing factor, arginine/serine-rich 19-like [Anolis sagrei ordinatus]